MSTTTTNAHVPFIRCEKRSVLLHRHLPEDGTTEFYFASQNILSDLSFVTPKAWGYFSQPITITVEESEGIVPLVAATMHFIVGRDEQGRMLHHATVLQVHTESPVCTTATTGGTLQETESERENARLTAAAKNCCLTGRTFDEALEAIVPATLKEYTDRIGQRSFTPCS